MLHASPERERAIAFPCVSAAVLSKTDQACACACGAEIFHEAEDLRVDKLLNRFLFCCPRRRQATAASPSPSPTASDAAYQLADAVGARIQAPIAPPPAAFASTLLEPVEWEPEVETPNASSGGPAELDPWDSPVREPALPPVDLVPAPIMCARLHPPLPTASVPTGARPTLGTLCSKTANSSMHGCALLQAGAAAVPAGWARGDRECCQQRRRHSAGRFDHAGDRRQVCRRLPGPFRRQDLEVRAVLPSPVL